MTDPWRQWAASQAVDPEAGPGTSAAPGAQCGYSFTTAKAGTPPRGEWFPCSHYNCKGKPHCLLNPDAVQVQLAGKSSAHTLRAREAAKPSIWCPWHLPSEVFSPPPSLIKSGVPQPEEAGLEARQPNLVAISHWFSKSNLVSLGFPKLTLKSGFPARTSFLRFRFTYPNTYLMAPFGCLVDIPNLTGPVMSSCCSPLFSSPRSHSWSPHQTPFPINSFVVPLTFSQDVCDNIHHSLFACQMSANYEGSWDQTLYRFCSPLSSLCLVFISSLSHPFFS